MSSYLNNLLSRSFKQTEVIRPRLPSIFEPVTTPGIPASGQRYSAPDRIENQVKNYTDWGFNSKEFLNGSEKGIDHSTGLSRFSGPFELSEKQKNFLRYSGLTEFQSETQDPTSGSKPDQQKTDPAGSMRIKPTMKERSQLEFTGSDSSRLDQAFSENVVPFFSLSGNFGKSRREKELLNIESTEDSLQSAYRQIFNGNTTEREYENKPSVGQLERFDSVQNAFQHGSGEELVRKSNLILRENILSGELNPTPEKSNFTSSSNLIVPKLSENNAAIKIKQLENLASPTAPDLRAEVKAKAEIEVEKPVIRINIGRIEVKAITQTSQPRRENKPQAPKLSLNDYLNSRNGGKV